VQKLTDMGFLVPARYFAPTIPDLTGVKVDGDYDRRELEVAMNQRRLVGDIVTHWHRLALGRPTVVFASGVRHSINLRDEFVKSGVKAEHIDGETKLADRKNIIRNIRSGRTRVITNYGVLTEGFDEPKLSCCVMARPTRNFGLSIQMAGRTLRPADDKKDTIILDHSGNVYEHGFIADDHQWILEEGRALTTDRKKRQETFDAKGPITCIKCSAMFIGQRMCPYCGYLPQRKGEYLETRHGELMEVRAKKRRTAKKRTYTMDEKQQWYSMFIFYCTEKKYKPGWAAAKYKTKFKVWPKGLHKVPAAPSSECLSYIRAMNIRYAKSKEKKAAA
jgi:superfamily II DNA or RNA helicase